MDKVSNAGEVVVGEYYWLASKVNKDSNGKPSAHISMCLCNDDREPVFDGVMGIDVAMNDFDIYGPIEKPVTENDTANIANDGDRLSELVDKADEYFRSLLKLSEDSGRLESEGIVDYEDDDEGGLLDNDIAKLEILCEFTDGLSLADMKYIRDHYEGLGEYSRVLVIDNIIYERF